MEREQSLVDQWVSLTEERNAVLVPAAGSGIPGAPADWTPPSGMEPHIPVLFLDLNGTMKADNANYLYDTVSTAWFDPYQNVYIKLSLLSQLTTCRRINRARRYR